MSTHVSPKLVKPVIIISLSYCKWNVTSLVLLNIDILKRCYKLSMSVSLVYMT
jgi:hypothetical protein